MAGWLAEKTSEDLFSAVSKPMFCEQIFITMGIFFSIFSESFKICTLFQLLQDIMCGFSIYSRWVPISALLQTQHLQFSFSHHFANSEIVGFCKIR